MIVVVCPAGGGINHVAGQVARQLRRDGEDVALYSLPDDGDVVTPSGDSARHAGTKHAAAGIAVRAAWRHRRRLRAADTVHVELGRNSIGAFWFAIAVAVLRRRRDLILVAHDMPHAIRSPGAGLLRTRPGWRDALAYRLIAPATDRLLLAVLRACVAQTVVLSEDAAALAEASGWPGIHVICHGAAPPTQGAPPPSRGRHVLMAGFIGPGKGIDVLAAAWEKTYTTLPLVIAGGTSRQNQAWADQVRADLDRASSPSRWLGYVDEETFNELFASAAVVVMPYAASNPVSGVLIRALVEGRPVVATRVPAAVSEITDGENGLLVDVGDGAALAEALNRLLTSPRLRDQLGAAAGERARRRHTWRQHVASLRSIYAAGSRRHRSSGEARVVDRTGSGAEHRHRTRARQGGT